MKRNLGASESSWVPYESNFEEQKVDGAAALCLSSFALHKPEYKTARELKAIKARHLGKRCEKRKAECGTGNEKPMKNGSIKEFPEAGKGIDGLILPEFPPVESLNGQIGSCSKPFEKQLTKSDLKVTQNRLLLNTDDACNFLLPLLKPWEDLSAGIPVIVYDSEGRKHPMTFKVWNGKVHVLIGNWIEFARNHGFQETTDWITVWMFRHRCSEKLCFVIISRRFGTLERLPRRRRTAPSPPKHGRVEAPATALQKEHSYGVKGTLLPGK